MIRILQFILLSAFSLTVLAEEPIAQSQTERPPPEIIYTEPAPSFSELPYTIWDDLGIFVKRIDPAENYKFLLGLTAGTLILVKYDQDILDASQDFARRIGLISDTKTGREGRDVIDLSFGGLDIPIRIPKNTNAAMYFIGDGITHIAIAGSLSIYGMSNDDFRATNTASQIMESALVSGTVVQILKRITGRQSPYHSTQDGGEWDFLPSFSDYASDVPNYDAFPSGHISTAMATTTVLAYNYPEHTYIKPLGYTLMGLLSWAMLNNGVHWASDYPAGIAIGWLAADIAYERGKKRRRLHENESTTQKSDLQLNAVLPYTFSNDGYGVLFNFSF